MIRIRKSKTVPAILQSKGKQETSNNINDYRSNPQAYIDGEKSFDFDSGVYGHPSVKKQLIADQYGKCCFCESKFTATSYGDVEHFRPKAGFKQQSGDRLKKPGYFWLVYDWNNLLFSCQICNQKHKRNFFPLLTEQNRAKDHNYPLEPAEERLLVDSIEDDPEQHISFRQEIPYGLDEKGKTSINIYGLNRENLNEERREYLKKFELASSFYELSQAKKDQIRALFPSKLSDSELETMLTENKQFVKNAFSDAAPYAGMIRANFVDNTSL
ncbi:MAG: hypothetical protein SF052_14800 [Bacteroidia bacterium]|nr:hypothetical protein [Bacteroidia bacterium]